MILYEYYVNWYGYNTMLSVITKITMKQNMYKTLYICKPPKLYTFMLIICFGQNCNCSSYDYELLYLYVYGLFIFFLYFHV